MVVFKDDPEKYNSPEMFLKIQQDMDNVMALVKQLNKMEEEIILNPSVRQLFINPLYYYYNWRYFPCLFQYIKKAVGNQDEDMATQHVKAFAG